MFFKRIFGKKAPEPIQLEKLSIDSLEEWVNKLKREKLTEAKSKLNSMLDGISGERKATLNELKKLSETEPTEEAYPGLRKSALEARRLLADKLTRALAEVQLQGEPSAGELTALDGKLAKMVNLTTDAIAIHSRHVRVLFGPHLNTIEMHLRGLHGLVKEAHVLIEGTLREMRSLDSISSKISSRMELLHRIEKMRVDAKSMESHVVKLEGLIGDERSQLTRLVESEEFRGLDASGRELERIEREIAQVKSTVSSAISGLSRPMRKMEKLVRDGECPIDREMEKVLKLCIEDPIKVLSSNEKISAAEDLLKKTVELLEEGKITMGERERKKRVDLARELLEEKKLLKLRERLTRLHSCMEAQKSARERTPLLKQKAELERSIEQHEADMKRARASIEELHRESKLLEGRIDENLRELEKLASEVIGARLELTS